MYPYPHGFQLALCHRVRRLHLHVQRGMGLPDGMRTYVEVCWDQPDMNMTLVGRSAVAAEANPEWQTAFTIESPQCIAMSKLVLQVYEDRTTSKKTDVLIGQVILDNTVISQVGVRPISGGRKFYLDLTEAAQNTHPESDALPTKPCLELNLQLEQVRPLA
jgi:hypothetical protein